MARTSSKKAAARGLTAQQRLFAHEVATPGVSQAAAYRSAYPHVTQRTAEVQGSLLMKNPEVAKLVETLRSKRVAKVDARAEEVLEELRHVALARLSRVIRIHPDQTPSVSVLPLEEWQEHELAALTDVDVEKVFGPAFEDGEGRVHVGDILKLKMKGKQHALETLAKHHGLLKEVVEHRGDFFLVNPYAEPPGGRHATGPGKPAASEGGK